jgi:hypothetical protein
VESIREPEGYHAKYKTNPAVFVWLVSSEHFYNFAPLRLRERIGSVRRNVGRRYNRECPDNRGGEEWQRDYFHARNGADRKGIRPKPLIEDSRNSTGRRDPKSDSRPGPQVRGT